MLTDKQLETVSVRLYNRLNKVNADYLIKIGERIKEIGDLRPTEVHQIQRIYEMAGQDIDAITAELALAGGKTIDDINELFRAVAKENYDYSAPFYEAKGIKQIPFDDNRKLQEYIASVANQTVDEFKNLTQHTAFMVWGKNGEVAPAYFKENVRKIPTSLSETYTRAIDEAVTKAQLGLTDYRSAIRDTVRALADSGIKTVDYATGYSRRLDSSVEQNVLWGLKQCNQHISDRVGEEFGADGYEIDYHSNPRPSHAEMGGRQYAVGNKGVTVGGKYYPPFSSVESLLQDYGCLHFKYPIVLGVSEPAWSDSDLAEMKARDKRVVEFEGKQYTKYEAKQVQHRLESAARNAKDRQTIARASGDMELARKEQQRINQITKKYADFSKASGLETKMERMRSAGYRPIKTKSELLTLEVRNIVTSNGITITKASEHVVDRAESRGIADLASKQNITDTLTNPLDIGKAEKVSNLLERK